jgi:hypothetical protein
MPFQLYMLRVGFKFVFCIFDLELCFTRHTHSSVTNLDESQVVLKQTKALRTATEQHTNKQAL